MRSSFVIVACALALSCGGGVRSASDDGDASSSSGPDGSFDDASLLGDAGDAAKHFDAGPRHLPPIDAGTIDGGDVWCGDVDGSARYCRTPQQYCCVDSVGDGFSYRCESPSAPVACGGMLFCDDRADCPNGAVCCIGGNTGGRRGRFRLLDATLPRLENLAEHLGGRDVRSRRRCRRRHLPAEHAVPNGRVRAGGDSTCR